MRIVPLLLAAAFVLTATAAEPPKRDSGSFGTGELLPQIAAGGAWSTDIQIMHAHDEDTPQPWTLRFFGSNGAPLTVPVVGQGSVSVLAGALQPRGSQLIQLAGGSDTVVGYALLDTTEFRGVVMNAVLTQRVANRPDFQAAVPGLDDFGDEFQFPFRNDGAFTTTYAFVSGTDQQITAIARNEAGVETCRATWSMEEGRHEGVLLTDRLPCTNGVRGVVEIIPQWWGGLIAFLFNDTGAFTTQLPFEICCRGL